MILRINLGNCQKRTPLPASQTAKVLSTTCRILDLNPLAINLPPLEAKHSNEMNRGFLARTRYFYDLLNKFGDNLRFKSKLWAIENLKDSTEYLENEDEANQILNLSKGEPQIKQLNYLLGKAAIHKIKQGRVKEALIIVKKMSHGPRFEQIDALLSVGEIGAAATLGELVRNPIEKANALAQVLLLLTKYPEENAKQIYLIIHKLRHLVKTVEDSYWGQVAANVFIEVMVKLGREGEAHSYIKDIKNQEARMNALCLLIKYLCGLGQIEKAEEFLAGVDGEIKQSEAVCEIIRALAFSGQVEKLKLYYSKVKDKGITPFLCRAKAYIGEALLGKGRINQALEYYRVIEDYSSRLYLASKIAEKAQKMVEAGEPEKALSLVLKTHSRLTKLDYSKIRIKTIIDIAKKVQDEAGHKKVVNLIKKRLRDVNRAERDGQDQIDWYADQLRSGQKLSLSHERLLFNKLDILIDIYKAFDFSGETEEGLAVLSKVLSVVTELDGYDQNKYIEKIIKAMIEVDPQISLSARAEKLRKLQVYQEEVKRVNQIRERKDEILKTESSQMQPIIDLGSDYHQAAQDLAESKAIKDKLIVDLKSNNPRTIENAFYDYLECGQKIPEIKEVLAGLLKRVDYYLDVMRAIVDIDPVYADRVIIAYLEYNPKIEEYDLSQVEELALQYSLSQTICQISQIKMIEGLREEMKLIAEKILDRIMDYLEIDADLMVTTSEGDEGYLGQVQMRVPMFMAGFSLSLRLEPTLELRQELQMKMSLEMILENIDNFLNIEEGNSIEDMRERIQTLNFLVHHEVGHIIQWANSIPAPEIEHFENLNNNFVKHQANEVLVDKLGFDAARKIFVHRDQSNYHLSSEVISVNAFIALVKVILKKPSRYNYAMFARIIAGLLEIAELPDLDQDIKQQLIDLAGTVYPEAAEQLKDNPQAIIELKRLIDAYRKIFRETELET